MTKAEQRVFEFDWNKKRVHFELLVMIMSKTRKSILLLVVLLLCTALFAVPAMAATTQLHIVKYANDGTTILNETTKTYQWMEANLPVLGDGTTHYYSQGPTFNDSDLWDDAELQNIDTRDWGAVKGTDLKDICNLVGGMSAGETVKIKPVTDSAKHSPMNISTPQTRVRDRWVSRGTVQMMDMYPVILMACVSSCLLMQKPIRMAGIHQAGMSLEMPICVIAGRRTIGIIIAAHILRLVAFQ